MGSRQQRTRPPQSQSAHESSANGQKSGSLHVVATPIGNLADLSPRAREILAAAALVLAEDTRHTGQLLATCGVSAQLMSLHEHNETQRIPEILARLGRGEQIALVSDAGTPLVSDPGYRLVRAVAEAGFEVRAVPGACAAVAALSIAGLPSDRFAFEGFLPAKGGARRTRVSELAPAPHTMIFYEAPHRLAETLADLAQLLGPSRPAVVARELTKMYETVYRGTLGELTQRAARDGQMQRGEIVIVVAGAPSVPQDEAQVRRVLEILMKQLPARQAAELAAQVTRTAPNAAYRLALELKKDAD